MYSGSNLKIYSRVVLTIIIVKITEATIPNYQVVLMVKNPPANAGDKGLVPESGGSPGGRNGNPLQYSCLENPMDTGGWRATVHGATKNRTRLSEHARTREEVENEQRSWRHAAERLKLRTRGAEKAEEHCVSSVCLSVPASVSLDCTTSEVSPWTEATGQDANVGNTGTQCGSS